MSKANLSCLCIFIVGLFMQSKDIPEKTSTYTVYVNFEDYSVRANVLFEAGRVKTKMGHTYYWYLNNDIKKTDGSFDGKLLHGEYKSFYRNMNLREQGNFNYGLKDGGWKTWYLNGTIHEIMNFRNGLEHGVHELYDENGAIVSKTYFKNGIQNGKMISYRENNVDTIIIYKNGVPKMPRPDKSHLHLKNKKETDSIQKENSKTNKTKDTIARTPKSSFQIKKIFNKKEKKAEQAKPERGKGTPEKKKKSPGHISNKKS